MHGLCCKTVSTLPAQSSARQMTTMNGRAMSLNGFCQKLWMTSISTVTTTNHFLLSCGQGSLPWIGGPSLG
eukprot:1157735-Pelagomonas_calceolata.AAC.7